MTRYFDAEKLAKEILRAWKLWEKKGEDCFLFSDVITPILVGQPTADVRENVHGEWIWSPVADDGTVSGCCNKCSFSHLFIGGHTAQYNFCPNCGADMRKR